MAGRQRARRTVRSTRAALAVACMAAALCAGSPARAEPPGEAAGPAETSATGLHPETLVERLESLGWTADALPAPFGVPDAAEVVHDELVFERFGLYASVSFPMAGGHGRRSLEFLIFDDEAAAEAGFPAAYFPPDAVEAVDRLRVYRVPRGPDADVAHDIRCAHLPAAPDDPPDQVACAGWHPGSQVVVSALVDGFEFREPATAESLRRSVARAVAIGAAAVEGVEDRLGMERKIFAAARAVSWEGALEPGRLARRLSERTFSGPQYAAAGSTPQGSAEDAGVAVPGLGLTRAEGVPLADTGGRHRVVMLVLKDAWTAAKWFGFANFIREPGVRRDGNPRFRSTAAVDPEDSDRRIEVRCAHYDVASSPPPTRLQCAGRLSESQVLVVVVVDGVALADETTARTVSAAAEDVAFAGVLDAVLAEAAQRGGGTPGDGTASVEDRTR